jgi:cytochrome c biogenesis protein CcdA
MNQAMAAPVIAGSTNWLDSVVASPEFTMAALPAAFVLGVLGVVASCCTLPALGAVAGYSAANDAKGERAALTASVAFLAGTFIALVAAGLVAGLAGQAAAGGLGRYWKLFAGLGSLFFGAAALDILPFRMPSIRVPGMAGSAGPAVFGLLVGGATTACSVTCNPAIAVFLGVSILKGKALWGAAVLAAFAAGYSLPLAAVLAGISLGKTAIGQERISRVAGWVGGLILVVLGIYFLATF